MFIRVEKDGASVFLDKDSIMKLSISKDGSLRQSERLVKVEFKNGTTGVYTIHRKSESSLTSSLTESWFGASTGCCDGPSEEALEETTEEPALV